MILSSFFAVALLATVGWGVNKSMKSDANLSDLALANVEALAQSEEPVLIPCSKAMGETCNFTCVLSDGTEGTCSFPNMIKDN